MKRSRSLSPALIVGLLALLPAFAPAQDTTRTAKHRNRATTDATFQSTNADVSNADVSNADIGTSALYFSRKFGGTLGTPYFLPTWQKGELTMTDGKVMPNAMLKYNVYRQELMMLRTWAGGDSITLAPAQIASFRLAVDGATFQFQRIDDGYYQVLADGQMKLYKRFIKSFRRPDNIGHYSDNNRYDQYKDESAYYVARPDGRMERVRLNTKTVLKTLNLPDDVRQKLTAEGLTADNEPNAVRLFQALNRL